MMSSGPRNCFGHRLFHQQETEKYLEDVAKLRGYSAARLRFYMGFMENSEAMLARGYDEFAQSPYDEVKAVRDAMDRDQTLEMDS